MKITRQPDPEGNEIPHHITRDYNKQSLGERDGKPSNNKNRNAM
jgi:hypothetical protein